MKSKLIRINGNSFNIKIFKDASHSERYPWVVEINGGFINNGLDREDAIALARNWVEVFETQRIKDEIKRHFKYTYPKTGEV